MKILVVGSGGREHTMVWKIAQSPKVKKVFCAPGNAGTSLLAENIPINVDNMEGLLEFAKKEDISLAFIGPELPLVMGISDLFNQEGIPVFGPSQRASQLEGSKIFCKTLMAKYGIPTADYKTFEDANAALDYVITKKTPLVIKADGLAAGKGVFVTSTVEDAENAIKEIMIKNSFGEAGDRIIVEECLIGEEASFLAFTDGKTVLPMASSQDHKRIYDGDKGPNTGGMGAYSPAPVIDEEMANTIMTSIMIPIVNALQKEGRPYSGVLYAGIMIDDSGPKVLEFNVRFGDPETQVILPRMETDLVEIAQAVVEKRLHEMVLDWKGQTALTVVLASQGYPGPYEKGQAISGLEWFDSSDDCIAFHAGTKKNGNEIITNGGRVMSITGLGASVKAAGDVAYGGVSKVGFRGMQFRKDLGYRAVNR
ncbi:MAG: phosphoribosylamine--glycine ligase [Candidatus Theseobacter exili]|nr:phosphoribosylamine--glycine ligase [Candidatus Theseobacter exili]